VNTRAGAIFAVAAGLLGVLAAMALPFAPVITTQTIVTWPIAGQPVASTTALFVPYRPDELTATVPCAAIRAAADRGVATTVLATGPDGDGLVLRNGVGGAQLLLEHRSVTLVPTDAGTGCQFTVHATRDGVTISGGGRRTTTVPGDPVPKVFEFRSDLDPAQAAGMTVTARTASPFATRPTTLKVLLVAAQLVAVLTALGLLIHARRRASVPAHPDQPRVPLRRRVKLRRACWVDAVVIAVLVGWAVVGPLAVDDGWAATIARNYAATGNTGNYYRWWNASETPFAFSQQLLAPLTDISLAPLWLRLPSTLLAISTWFVLSRGVLGAALPTLAGTARIRLLTALCLLVAWLPFDLGARPESYVAFGVTTVLALLWRARDPAAVGGAALVAGLTIPISPTSVIVAAPIVVFAPRAIRTLRRTAPAQFGLLIHLVLLATIGSVASTVIFADQTWDGLITATQWHTFFGPSLPWYHEPDRYHYLFGDGQQGSFAKRSPVLLAVALLPITGLLFARRTERSAHLRSAVRLAAVMITAMALLSLVPSKWSYHLGALAGLFAAFVTVAAVTLISRTRKPVDPTTAAIAVIGGMLVASASAVSFAGANAWWLPEIYDVPWALGPVRPLGVPLDCVLLWIGGLTLGCTVFAAISVRRGRGGIAGALIAGPAILTVIGAATTVVVLVSSFVIAPVRRPSGSLAVANVRWMTERSSCGVADDIEVLQDGKVLRRATATGQLAGFTALGGFDPDWPPPDPPGYGMSTDLWGSHTDGPHGAATMTSPWFTLPALNSDEGLSVSVSGRGDVPDGLAFEFGRADANPQLGAANDSVIALADVAAYDRMSPGDDPASFLWRTVTIDAAQVPAGSNRVRIRAVDANTDPAVWVAFTGPRRHTVIGLSEFLAGHAPVLVSWPQSFLFPCVRDIAGVVNGLAQTPRALIVAPGPWFTQATDQQIGGDFAGLVFFNGLHEVATRLTGHPDIRWGTLLVAADTATTDAYQRQVIDVRRFGHEEIGRVYQVQLPH
jgi:arabinosyltransferase B